MFLFPVVGDLKSPILLSLLVDGVLVKPGEVWHPSGSKGGWNLLECHEDQSASGILGVKLWA